MSSVFNVNNLIFCNNNDNNNKHNQNNDNFSYYDLTKINNYLSNPNIKLYRKLFRKRKRKNVDKPSIFTLDVFYNNNNENYFCSTCKLHFRNYNSHNFIMFDKCPSVIKNNKIILLETIHETHYHNIKFITKPDLDIEMKIVKDEKDESFYITNHLYIKCPICLKFKQNCIIQECGHCLCKNCLNTLLKSISLTDLKCWMCRQMWNKKNKNLLFKL